MTVLQAAGAGFIQGVTEFLPVSSSGHLVLFQELLSFSESSLLLEASVHAATLGAVIVFFWKRIIGLSVRELGLLLVGSIPAAVVGLLFKEQLEALFSSVLIVSVAIAFTGVINLLIHKKVSQKSASNSDLEEAQESDREKYPSLRQVFIVGCAQAAAIIPGISRSGSTIGSGLYLGLTKDTAFTYSFLLSLPAIGGAFALQLLDVYQSGMQPAGGIFSYGVAMLVAGVTGFVCLKLLRYVLLNNHFQWFAVYCFVVSALGIGAVLFV